MKKILITGASSGIGLAAAKVLHASGHELFLIARRADKLQEIQAQLGERVHVHTVDVVNYESVKQMASEAISKMGQIDVLINNAGLGYFDPLVEGKIEEWHEMFDINVKGLLNCLHACLPHLIESKGHVINLGSLASHYVFPNSGVYSATKHAVFAISESIRTELPDKVRVTTISPGSVNTPFIDSTTNEKLLAEYKNYFAAGMSAEWIAETIRFAVEAPASAVVSEIITRPNRQVK
ncbi:MAG: SDR family oxidoreductase [Flavobacteriales bacterium]